MRKVVLWGLCDAASAILLTLHAKPDDRVGGVVLLNPWVRSEASLAQTHIKHYLLRAAPDAPEFWRKLFSGKLRIVASLRELLRNARARPAVVNQREVIGKLLSGQDGRGTAAFSGQTLLVLSGQDYRTRVHRLRGNANPAWSA